MLGLTFDQWMNISGIGGVTIYLGTFWWMLRDVSGRGKKVIRILHRIGLALILMPLLLRWYFSSEMILFFSIMILLIATGMWFFHQRDKS